MFELHTPEQAARWLRSHVSGALTTDSRKVRAGDGFIAWPGAATDGRQYVNAALAQGARACLVEQAGVESFDFKSERVAAYAQLKAGSGPIAANYYEQPSREMEVLAVTGTNGKTSTTWWLAQALTELSPSIPCGLIGTLGVGRAPRADTQEHATAKVVSTGLTTPDPVLLQQTLRRFVDEGLKACAIEASSIGIEERRLDGLRIHTAVFTNFTQDHLDYHGGMDAYWQAKAALFDWPELRAAVINIDDERGAELAHSLSARALDVWTVSCRGPARLMARAIRFDGQGLRFSVCEGDAQTEISTHLIGEYNVSNLLEVIAAMRTLGVPLADCVNACRVLHPVPGRMELQAIPDQPLAVVDYAHTPDALAQVLQALRPLARQRGGQLWCVFGCGGDRDPTKRPLMGAVAAQHADRIVLTSDNPRSERAEVIISQILLGLEGVASVEVQADRAQAIAQTVQQADARDVVLVAGKGHEDYQETAGVRQPFSDRLELGKALQARARPAAAGGAA